jgi:hypothetical protein
MEFVTVRHNARDASMPDQVVRQRYPHDRHPKVEIAAGAYSRAALRLVYPQRDVLVVRVCAGTHRSPEDLGATYVWRGTAPVFVGRTMIVIYPKRPSIEMMPANTLRFPQAQSWQRKTTVRPATKLCC